MAIFVCGTASMHFSPMRMPTRIRHRHGIRFRRTPRELPTLLQRLDAFNYRLTDLPNEFGTTRGRQCHLFIAR